MMKTIANRITVATIVITMLFASIISIDLNAATKPEQVKGLILTNTHNSITARWKKAKGAKQYIVEITRPYKAWNKYKIVKNTKKNKKKYNKKNYKTQRTGGKLQVLKYCVGKTWFKTQKTKYVFRGLKKNMRYKVRIRACRGVKKGKFSVVKSRKTFVALKKVTVNNKDITVNRGKTEQIITTKTPSNATQNETYRSEDPSVATVDKNGEVTGKTPGNTTVVVDPGDNEVDVTVRKPSVYEELLDIIWEWNETHPDSIIPYENKQEYEYDQDIAKANLKEIKSKYGINKNSSDEYIVIAVAEWLCDRLTYRRDGPDGLFLSGTVVNCSGYASQYQYYLTQLGVECFHVGISKSNHAVNIVKIDGDYYYVNLSGTDSDIRIIYEDSFTYSFVKSAKYISTRQPSYSGLTILPYDNPINPVNTKYDNWKWKEWKQVLERGY